MAYTMDDIANQVIRGNWGNGVERKQRLAAAGYDVDKVQRRVNAIMGGDKSADSSSPLLVQEIAPTAVSAPAPSSTSAPPYEQNKPVYAPSRVTTDAENKMNDWESNKPGPYQNEAARQLEQMLGNITSRPGFSYDFNADPLYQQYKDQYMQLGNAAMRDTMGNAAALSGGYGNSYATTAGNQAYQGYLSQLNKVIPELYNAAYSRYADEGEELRDRLQLLRRAESDEYGRYRDSVADYHTGWENLTDAYRDARNADVNQFQTTLGQWNKDNDFRYRAKQDEYQREKKYS